MKKLLAFCFSLILIISMTASCYGDQIVIIDPYTGAVVNSDEGDSVISTTGLVSLNAICSYDVYADRYIYTLSSQNNLTVSSSVFNGMITTDPVAIEGAEGAQYAIYLSGEIVSPDENGMISSAGTYIVQDSVKKTELFRFTIVNPVTNAINIYNVPSIFYVSEVYKDAQRVVTGGNEVAMTEDGQYKVLYFNDDFDKGYTLDVIVDHQAPVLKIDGVDEKGNAYGPVTFSNIEENSVMTIQKDGEYIVLSEELSDSGDYVVTYSDQAGNTVTYLFTINFFLDTGGGFFVGLVAALIVAAIVYLIYSRKHLRVF